MNISWVVLKIFFQINSFLIKTTSKIVDLMLHLNYSDEIRKVVVHLNELTIIYYIMYFSDSIDLITFVHNF